MHKVGRKEYIRYKILRISRKEGGEKGRKKGQKGRKDQMIK